MPLINFPNYNDLYFSEEFKVVIRSCKEILLSSSEPQPFEDLSFVFAHRNNAYALLRGLGVDERLLWVTCFINDINDPTGDVSYLKGIRTVTLDTIDSIILPLKTKYV